MSVPSDPFKAALADRYAIERELGRGGMATVFLAKDLRHQRQVALKLLEPRLAAEIGTERFEREIRLAARLQHPHICSVYDSGAAGDQLWFAMPFIEGESLDTRLEREGTLPVDEALRIAREAALALAYAHDHGVVHRDIKPANLLLTRDGSVLVADFGIARAVATTTGAGEPTLTQSGFSPGTPAYMSPEQKAGVANVDGRSDVYSLGLVLFEMLTGTRPFGGGMLEAFAQALSDPVPRVKQVRADVPAGVDVVLQRALATHPDQRYPTIAEMGNDLDTIARGKPLASPGGNRRRGSRRILAIGAVALLLAVLGYGLFRGRAGSDTTLLRSTAVLPFADLSPDHADAYFSEGLAEELTTALAKIPGLRVAARSSAFQFRDSPIDVREVSRRLHVGTVLEGSVRRNGSRIKVSAQLVNANDGYELWSEIYDRDQADVFQVQEEIARAIGAALRVRLASSVDSALRHRPTGSLQAYDLYLKGRFAINQRTDATLPEAARLFEGALALDSGMARAWSGLADAKLLLPLYSGVDPKVAWPQAKAAALRAIALDSTSAEAYTSLAYGTMLNEWDWAGAERAFQKAIAVDSTYPTAHHWYADFLAGRGRLDEALVQIDRARQLDPLSRIIPTEHGWMLLAQGRTREADSVLSEVLRIDPGFSQGLFVLAQVRIVEKRYDDAIRMVRQSLATGGSSSHGSGVLIAALALSGDRPGAQAVLDSVTQQSKREYVPPFALAMAYANLGDLDRAYAMLERGIAERDVLLPENFFEPLLDPIRRDPRY
ncbi:MAG TPA: protein kinase, partial [Gemmatimonadales bacterium]|nr:protein kinase [Gemmatimonadales bacterium]